VRAGGARSQCFAQGRREVRAGCVRAQGTVVQDQTDGMTCVPFATSAVRAGGARSQCFAQSGLEVRVPSAVPYALPICHAASGRAASAPRSAGFQPAYKHPRHRRQMLTVAAGAQARISCNITVYAQGLHSYLTDSLIGTSTFSNLVTRMGNGMPRTESRARLARQHGCRTPNYATRVMVVGNGIYTET